MNYRYLLSFILALIYDGVAHGQSLEPSGIIGKADRQWLAEELRNDRAQHGGNSDFLVQESLVADRKSQSIELLAFATGVEPGTPVEFILVGEFGRDYESIAVTTVLPSQIQRALEFIGMEPGRPVDYSKQRFWPKGERVIVSFYPVPDGNAGGNVNAPSNLRAENLVFDLARQQSLPETGFPFVGSVWRKSDEPGGEPVCEADNYSEIITVFNSPWTQLDVPYRVRQGEIYGNISVNPAFLFKKGQRLRIRIRPERPLTDPRVTTISLTAMPVDSGKNSPLAGIVFGLKTNAAPNVASRVTFDEVLGNLNGHVREGHDVFVNLGFDDALSLRSVREVCALFQPIEKAGIIRIEAMDQHPYFEAMLPNPAWRGTGHRPSQPVELHLRQWRNADELECEVIRYGPASGRPRQKMEIRKFDFHDLRAVKAHFEKPESTRPVNLFIFIPAALQYEALRELYNIIDPHFATTHVFLTE